MLLHAQCQLVVLDEDIGLLSKVGFIARRDGQERLWWSLDYLFDKFKASGDEKRVLFKWIQFFKQKVSQSTFCDDPFFCQTKQTNLPQHALHENVATTFAVLVFFNVLLKESRTPKTVQMLKNWIPVLCNSACSMLSILVSLDVEDLQPLIVSPAGLVKGMESMLSSKHRTCFFAVQKEWQSMHESGELSEELISDADSAIPLQDLLWFVVSVDRKRRSSGGHVWPKDSVTGSTLLKLQKALLDFVAQGIDRYVKESYIQTHNTDKPAPSRRVLGIASDVPDGQVAPNPATKVMMSPDAIYELFSQARETSVSMKQALSFLQGERVSSMAGCKPTAVDPWVRRAQSIYDERAALSLLGVTHYNLVSDCSVHSGKEYLVSICYSHQASTACFANIQQILPLAQITPGEIELTSVVEKLAQEPALEGNAVN